ncbi:hypothetical protein DTO012A7_8108 [Penicillium roqueforti]|nr:hypothetical protein LCP963914a_6158 [Penicillium roqueforti]KAI3223684.1 hypothetical protein DTO012A7_8108 [Penicillium roqueforti]
MITTSDRDNALKYFDCIGIVGAGNMGTQMAIAFSELGLNVSVWDVNEQNVDELWDWSRNNKTKGGIIGFHDIYEFVRSLEKQKCKLFLFSISHGNPAESVLGMIKSTLKDGDIVLDGAKDRQGNLCVARIGPGGSGYYVKMVYNGIEGGMLSILAEAWSFLYYGLELDYDSIADIFSRWNGDGELRGTYLVDIAVDMLRAKTSSGRLDGSNDSKENYMLDEVLDKVVQDDDDTEGTPYWNMMESASRHISTPTLATAHYLRIASGNRAERLLAAKKLQIPGPKLI